MTDATDLIRRGDAVKSLRDWQDSLNKQGMSDTAITIGMAADLVAALPSVGVTVKPGQIERAIWSAMIWAADNNPGFNGVPEYTDRGNSLAETECRRAVARILAALDVQPAPAPSPDEHNDDYSIRQFTKLMVEKMALSRAKGRSGWDNPETCSVDYLRTLLYEHLDKGDPVDVANFCMMLQHYGASTYREFCNCIPAPSPDVAAPVTMTIKPDLADVRAMIDNAEKEWAHLQTIAATIRVNTLRHGGTNQQADGFIKGEVDFIEWMIGKVAPSSAAPTIKIIQDRIDTIVREQGSWEPDTNVTNLPEWAETAIEELEGILAALARKGGA